MNALPDTGLTLCSDAQPEQLLAAALHRMMDDSPAGGCFSDCLFGVCTEGFEPFSRCTGMAVGNDAFSWGVCGNRLEKIHNDVEMSFGRKWKNGDVIGFALDMRNPGGTAMHVSVNGNFNSPNGIAFNIDARYLSPAFSAANGFYRVNFGVDPFIHSPPDAGAAYVSVQEFARLNPSEQRKQSEDGVGLFLMRGAGCSTRKLYKGQLAPVGNGDPRMCPLTMKFDAFNTFVADVKLCGGAFYYELQVLDGSHVGSLWSCEPFAKPEGTVSLHLDCGPCAHLICGDYEASAEVCNGRLIYYKRAGANMIIRRATLSPHCHEM